MQHEPAPPVFHDLADSSSVGRMVAVACAVLALRLGVQRARRPLDYRVRDQPRAGRAKMDGAAHQRRDVEMFHRDRPLEHARMLVPAVDVDELGQRLQILVERAMLHIGRLGPGKWLQAVLRRRQLVKSSRGYETRQHGIALSALRPGPPQLLDRV